MTTWRRLGRWMRQPRAVEPAPAPELSPMARHSIEWLARQPESRKMLAGLVARPEPVEPRRREPAAEPPAEPVARPHSPLAELTEKARQLTERVDRLVQADSEWSRLHDEGWTPEGLQELAQYAARNGMANDPRKAAAALERAMGRPEMAVSSGRRHFHTLDRAEAAAEREPTMHCSPATTRRS